jgi:hypothetical protein
MLRKERRILIRIQSSQRRIQMRTRTRVQPIPTNILQKTPFTIVSMYQSQLRLTNSIANIQVLWLI